MKFRICSLLLILCLLLGCGDDELQTKKVEDANTEIVVASAIESRQFQLNQITLKKLKTKLKTK